MKKWLVVGLVGGMAFVTDLIRIAMAIVAPTLMELYDISPQTMGLILSGWNWAYTGSLLFIGPIIDRFGPWLVVGMGAGFWGMATLALPLVSTAPMFFCHARPVRTGAQHADPRTGSLCLPLGGC